MFFLFEISVNVITDLMVNDRSHGKRKNGNLKRKNKHVLTLSELSIVIWILRIINSMIELINFMMQQFLPGVTLNMLFGHI